MDLNITRSKIDKLRQYLNKYTPYDEDDPILTEFDGEIDAGRMKATNAKRLLEQLGLSLTDPNDYGKIKK